MTVAATADRSPTGRSPRPSSSSAASTCRRCPTEAAVEARRAAAPGVHRRGPADPRVSTTVLSRARREIAPRRVGPAAGPARRAVPPPRPGRGRPGRRLRGGGPHLAGRTASPTNPGAWLLVAARRRITDRLRAEAVANRKLPLLAVEADLTEEAQRTMADPGERGGVADERLRLVLLCAHPSLPPEAAAALTLRLVLGVSTEDLARLFLVRTSTMAARLTRARKRLAGESFAVPVGAELTARVRVVSDVAYLAFTAGYAPGSGSDVLRADVAGEAIRLVRVLRDLLPAAGPGGRRAARADAAPALAPRRPGGRRPAGAAARPGPVPLARRRDRRGGRAAHPARPRRAGAVPPPGAGRRRARDRADRRATPTGRGSWRGTTSCSRWPTRPWSGSTAPSPSARRTARWPGWPRCDGLTRRGAARAPAAGGAAPSCWPAPAWSRRGADGVRRGHRRVRQRGGARAPRGAPGGPGAR